jgi:hypothetical protein
MGGSHLGRELPPKLGLAAVIGLTKVFSTIDFSSDWSVVRNRKRGLYL